MYLSTKEHDKLRTIVMGFEIPFRTYIAQKITLSYPDASSFFSAIDQITLPDNASQELKSKYGQMKSQFAYYYQLFEMTIQSSINKIVENDINVPDVGTLVSTIKIFEPLFHDYTSCFSNYNTFIAQLDKYHYVRNKLDHPGCKTLDTEDMIPTLNFISDSCTYIGIEYEECFWDKPEYDIYQEIRSLESLNSSIPIPINNFSNIPFSDKKIVCRNKEIEDVKTFIYGIPNALRKKSSLCIYGYGGLGKTAIVTEVIKSIVQDISDNNTTNNYHPDFILFFSAKEEFLEISQTSGDILCQKQRQNFTTLEELETSIYNALNIESFANFNKTGIIVIDNLESIHEDERAKIYTFVESMSPISVQYIITSRNEENYQERMGISGFSNTNGKKFIHEYVEENNLDLSLSETEMEQLLESTKGNTLVLVLSLRRLSRKIATIEGITSDLSALPTVSNIVNEFSTIPLNGYDIISEFMFKNTFDELEKTFKEHADLLFSLLKIFAVYPNQEIDIYTICMLSDLSYLNINPYINLLCQYLILEKNGETYHLNSFAEKYIIQKLLPDSNTYEKLSMKIKSSINEINTELDNLNQDLNTNPNVRNIITDWAIEYDGDKIAAAKSYHIYQNTLSDCRTESHFHVSSAYESAIKEFSMLERTTMHPYVKYQKARALGIIDQTHLLQENLKEDIDKAYIDCIWSIKTNSLYQKIKSTKTYASILWIYGSFLLNKSDAAEDKLAAIRYLEESVNCFQSLSVNDKEYYQCLTLLGNSYLDFFKITNNYAYFLKSKSIGNKLYKERFYYNNEPQVKSIATKLNTEIRKMENSINESSLST